MASLTKYNVEKKTLVEYANRWGPQFVLDMVYVMKEMKMIFKRSLEHVMEICFEVIANMGVP